MSRRTIITRVISAHYLLALIFYLALFVAFFSPIIFRGKLLAVGTDALYNFLPYFFSKKVRWDGFVFGGFPMMADPTAMTWYPPAWIFSRVNSWNSFVVYAYVCASFFTYAYVQRLSRSRIAGLVAGTIFGLSGFMIAHLGHAHVVQSAVWVPLLLWSIESQRTELKAKWFVIGVFATALMLLGGQPQIFCYGVPLGLAYVIFVGPAAITERWRFYLTSASAVALGTALAAIQIVPTLELAREASRASYTFSDYASHSLPPRQALTMLFPYLFGGPAHSGFIRYFGAPNQTEISGFVGLLPLMLSAVGVISREHRRAAVFWACIAVISFLLVMGDATPLARLLFHVPIIKSFRAPGRHFLEFTLAVSTLSGLGVAALIRREISLPAGFTVAGAAVLVVGVVLILLTLSSTHIHALALTADIGAVDLRPWKNPALGTPLLIFVIAITAFLFVCVSLDNTRKYALLFIVLLVELSSFGWFFEWRYSAIDNSELSPPQIDIRYRDLVSSAGQRVMPIRRPESELKAAQPTLSRLWSLPSADGYNALIPIRTGRLLDINERGEQINPVWQRQDLGLDVMAVRFVFTPPHRTMTDSNGVNWFQDNMQRWLGVGCDASGRTAFRVTFPKPISGSALGLVSRSACSAAVPNRTEIARVKIVDVNDTVETMSVIEGRDTSEWAYDCEPKVMRHMKAAVFSDYAANLHQTPCTGHSYVTRHHFDQTRSVKRLEFEAMPGSASLIVEKLTLIDEATNTSTALDPVMINPETWRSCDETAEAHVYENLHAAARAWIVNDVQMISDPQDALSVIRSGLLKDGRRFDPLRTALVEGVDAPATAAQDETTRTAINHVDSDRMEISVAAESNSFLVTSDIYYPGWRAYIDGKQTRLYRTDYAIRGVFIPPGEHLVSFKFKPKSLYLGAIITAVAALVVAAILIHGGWFAKRRRPAAR